MIEPSHHIELLNLAAQIAAQDKNGTTLTARLALPMNADSLTVVLAIAQELRKALESEDKPN